jgi:hypothetical protein
MVDLWEVLVAKQNKEIVTAAQQQIFDTADQLTITTLLFYFGNQLPAPASFFQTGDVIEVTLFVQNTQASQATAKITITGCLPEGPAWSPEAMLSYGGPDPLPCIPLGNAGKRGNMQEKASDHAAGDKNVINMPGSLSINTSPNLQGDTKYNFYVLQAPGAGYTTAKFIDELIKELWSDTVSKLTPDCIILQCVQIRAEVNTIRQVALVFSIKRYRLPSLRERRRPCSRFIPDKQMQEKAGVSIVATSGVAGFLSQNEKGMPVMDYSVPVVDTDGFYESFVELPRIMILELLIGKKLILNNIYTMTFVDSSIPQNLLRGAAFPSGISPRSSSLHSLRECREEGKHAGGKRGNMQGRT